jgi:hypothetical protein
MFSTLFGSFQPVPPSFGVQPVSLVSGPGGWGGLQTGQGEGSQGTKELENNDDHGNNHSSN